MSNESGFEYGISDDESQETDEAHAGHNGNGNGNGHRLTPRMVAEQVLMWDIMPIPLTNRADPKNVNRPAWEKERYTARDLDAFNDAIGVGFRLGHILDAEGNALTDRFADADLDTHEAVRCAEFYLPYTGMKWGRDNKPRSHWGYRLKSLDGAKSRQMTDPLRTSKDGGKDMICELRFSGHTVGPASYNVKEGLQPDLVRWEPDGDGPPSEVEFEKLETALECVHAAALVARYWTHGIRHLAALPLAGMLCRGGMKEEDAVVFMRAVCAGSKEDAEATSNRIAAVRDTYEKARNGQPYSGSITLETYLDPKVVTALRKHLRLSKTAYGGDVGKDGWPLSDIGNAERFVAKWSGTLLYCDDQNEWYVYDGSAWRVDRRHEVTACAIQVVNAFHDHITNLSLPDAGNTSPKQWQAHAKEMAKRKNVLAMLEFAKPSLAVLPEDFNSHPYLLNLKNGTLELNTRQGSVLLREHRARDLLTHVWDAEYHEDATDEGIDWARAKFLPEEDRWSFLEEARGYSLTGLPKRYNFQLLGPSNAGKSMFLRLLREPAGGYGGELAAGALKADSHGGGRTRTDLVDLRGTRLVTIAEVGEGVLWDVALFKTMTSGGDVYKARGAYERRTQTFAFTCALWTSGNKAYGGDASDDATYERIFVIKFEHPLPKEERDQDAEERLIASPSARDALLASAVRGFVRLYGEHHGRLVPPDSVVSATDEVRQKLDPYAVIMDTLIEITGDPHDGVLKSQLNEQAESVALREEGWKHWGTAERIKLEEAMTRRGVSVAHANEHFRNRFYWRGVRWTEDAKQRGSVELPDWER